MVHEYYSTLGFGWINVGYYVLASYRIGLIASVGGMFCGRSGLATSA